MMTSRDLGTQTGHLAGERAQLNLVLRSIPGPAPEVGRFFHEADLISLLIDNFDGGCQFRVERSFKVKVLGFVIEVMKPILVPLFWIMEKAYDFLFAASDLRMSVELQQRFETDVQRELPFLFSDYGGRLTPYELKKARPFDYAVARVALREFRLQFTRGRGECRAHIAPAHAPEELDDLSIVLSLIDETFQRRDFKSLADFRPVLEPRMSLLQDAMAVDRYSELVPQIENAHEHDRAIIRQWETEINRRLYPDK